MIRLSWNDVEVFEFGRFGVPEGCDLVAAGALPVAFGTSHVALLHRANLSSGQVSALLMIMCW